MGTFAERPLLYQVSLLLLLVATLSYGVGVAVPWWAQTYSGVRKTVVRHSGLWISCSKSVSSADSDSKARPSGEQCGPIADAPGWLRVVQGMQGAGLIVTLAACVYGLVVNFCLKRHHWSRAVEALAGTGGVLGIISAAVYVTKTHHALEHNRGISYSWALGIDLAASILLLFIAPTVAITNRRPDVDEATKVIVEDCEGNKVKDTRSRSRSPEKSARGRGTVGMERSPVRTRRLEAISEMGVSLEEEEEEEEEGDQKSRYSVSYVNSVGEVAHCDPRTDAL